MISVLKPFKQNKTTFDVPLSMLPLVLSTILGSSAYQLYNLWNATGKYCLKGKNAMDSSEANISVDI